MSKPHAPRAREQTESSRKIGSYFVARQQKTFIMRKEVREALDDYKNEFNEHCPSRKVGAFASYQSMIFVVSEISQLWFKCLFREWRGHYWLIRDAQVALTGISSIQDLAKYPAIDVLWKKTLALLKIMRTDDGSSEDNAFVLHAIAKYACPTIVMWLCTKLYPEQLSIPDSRGRLPLHYSCATDQDSVLTNKFHSDQSRLVWHHMGPLTYSFHYKSSSGRGRGSVHDYSSVESGCRTYYTGSTTSSRKFCQTYCGSV